MEDTNFILYCYDNTKIKNFIFVYIYRLILLFFSDLYDSTYIQFFVYINAYIINLYNIIYLYE